MNAISEKEMHQTDDSLSHTPKYSSGSKTDMGLGRCEWAGPQRVS